jgi:thioredoxin-related protein
MQRTFQKRIQAAALCLCCLLVASFLLNCENSPAAEKFKPFKLKTLDGATKRLQDYSNKAVLVMFLFPKCAYCNIALPEILRMSDTYKDLGLSVVFINVMPDQNKLIPDWQTKHHVTIPVLIGASQESLMDDYELDSTPTFYLLGEKGEVLFHQSKYERGDEKVIEAKITDALKITHSAAIAQKP